MWTHWHVITLLPSIPVYIAIALLVGWLLRKSSEETKMIPVHVITVLIVGLEVAKQVVSFEGGYDFDDLPLYYCSMFVFLYFFTSIYTGKHKDSVRLLTVVSGITLFVVMMVFPDVIYSDSAIENAFNDFGDFHTVAFHNLVLLGTAFMIVLRPFKFEFKKGLICCVIFYTIYCFIAAPMSAYLNENFNQFSTSYVDAIEDLRLQMISSMGSGWGQFCYVMCNMVTTIGFSVLMYLAFSLVVKICIKIAAKKRAR